MTNPRLYFPLGKAYGDAFCNRTEETAWLIGNITSAKHTLLLAPRRYGKSSLAENAIIKSKLPYTSIDLRLAVEPEDIEYMLLKATADLIGKSIGQLTKIINSIKQYVKVLQPKLTITPNNVELELTPTANEKPSITIIEALRLLEKLLSEKDKKAVLFIDEFQVVGKIAKGKGVEGAIRSAAQEMQHLSIIFSGSSRAMLKTMFEDENRPLYKLCRKLTVERISEKHYKKHLNKIAEKTWGKNISEDAFDTIIELTQNHPYYINYLCDVLWSQYRTPPLTEDVISSWHTIIEEERGDLLKEFLSLANSQRKILIHISNNSGKNLLGKETIKKLNLSSSTISKSASTLVDNDYIELCSGGYFIVNPALDTLLKK